MPCQSETLRIVHASVVNRRLKAGG